MVSRRRADGEESMEIEAEALAVERGGRIVVTNISFWLGAGEALAITGPNGAGKSSLLRALAGLLPFAGGAIRTDPERERLAELCHYVGHADALKPSLTIFENLEFWAALLAGTEIEKRPDKIEAALAKLGLARIADLPCAYLSAGQRRRAALARLAAIERPLWLLDEPSTALDAASQAALGEMMKSHLSSGGMIIAATHAPLPVPARELALGLTQ
jgi:heme exporter protein A